MSLQGLKGQSNLFNIIITDHKWDCFVSFYSTRNDYYPSLEIGYLKFELEIRVYSIYFSTFSLYHNNESMKGFLWQKMKARKKIAIGIALFLLLFFTVGRGILFPQAAVLKSYTIKEGNLQQELTLSGKIDAQEHAVLQFQTGGKLAWVGVKEGDSVSKDQMIAYLEKEKLQAVLRQAQQDFTAAKAEHEKYYDGHNDEPETFDEKIERTALDAKQNKAYDSLRIAEENVKDATIYSPYNGLVIRVDPVQGTNIYTPSQAQFEIVNPETIYFSVNADQSDVVSLKEGQRGVIYFDSYPDEKITGTINGISFTPSKDETGTTYEVKISINLSEINKYRLGMTGDITFVTKEKNHTLFLPSDYVKSDEKGKFVIAGKDKQKIYVKTGMETDTDIEIINGLSKGETVYD